MDRDVSAGAVQSQSADKAGQAEDMVTMKMGDEDMP